MKNVFEELMAPIKELNFLTLKSMEQITAIQTKAFMDYAKIGMYAVNTATEVKDLDSLKSYLESQIAVTHYVTDNAAVDVEELKEVGRSFATEVKEVVEKSIAVG
jgi:phasin family protein